MKNAARLMILALTILPLLAAAQMTPDQKLVANVPFDFVIGSKTVPAGEWTVQRTSSGAPVVTILNFDAKSGHLAKVSLDEARKPADRCALVFHKYGAQYFLASMKIEGSRVMYQLPESKAEAELRAMNQIGTEEILLAQLR